MDWWNNRDASFFTMGGSYSDFIAGICVYMCAERFFHTLQTNEINGSGDVIPQNCTSSHCPKIRSPNSPKEETSSAALKINLPASTCPQTTTERCCLLMVEIKEGVWGVCNMTNQKKSERLNGSGSAWWLAAESFSEGKLAW